MNNRLENLLTRESIDADDVTLAGTVQDFSIAKKVMQIRLFFLDFLKMLVTLYIMKMIGLC